MNVTPHHQGHGHESLSSPPPTHPHPSSPTVRSRPGPRSGCRSDQAAQLESRFCKPRAGKDHGRQGKVIASSSLNLDMQSSYRLQRRSRYLEGQSCLRWKRFLRLAVLDRIGVLSVRDRGRNYMTHGAFLWPSDSLGELRSLPASLSISVSRERRFRLAQEVQRFTVGPRGVRTTVGIPGTGLYHTEHHGTGTKRRRSRKTASSSTSSEPEDPLSPDFFKRLALPKSEEEFVDGVRQFHRW